MVKVAYNNSYRILNRLPMRSSASRMFASDNVNSCTCVICKSMYSLMTRIYTSLNPIAKIIVGATCIVRIIRIANNALNMTAYRSAARLYKVAIHTLFSFDATCTSLWITLCVIKLNETSSLQRKLYVDRLIFAWQLSTLEDANMALALHLIGKLRRIRNELL